MSASFIPAAFAAASATAMVAAALAAARASARLPHDGAARRSSATPPSWLVRATHRAVVPWSPLSVWRALLAIAAVAALGALALGGVSAALAALAAVIGLAALAAAAAPDRSTALHVAALPEAFESIANAVRSGCSLRDGVAAATARPLAGDMAAVVAAIDAGHGPVDAFDHWALRSPLPGVQLAAAAVAVSTRSGSSVARALDGVAATLRDRQRFAAELRALATQARLSAAVLAAAPPIFTLLLAGVEGGVVAFVAGSPVGWACLAGGLLLNGLGAVWMRRIVGALQ